MIDAKGVELLEVAFDNALVGHLTRTQDGSIFRYTDAFLASNQEPIALHLPKKPEGIEVRGVTNLPSFFAGLLPEGVVQDAIVRAGRMSRDDLFSQLALTAYDAVGDVTVRIPGHDYSKQPATVKDAKEKILLLVSGTKSEPISALSGVQPKASIGSAVASTRGTIAIVKVEPDRYPRLLENEAYFMALARKTGLRAAKAELQDGALVIERFDRIKQKGSRPRQVHVEDMLQILDRYPLAKYSLDYTEILDIAVRLQVSIAVLLDLLHLYAYSYVIANGDLHAKNVSLQYDRASRQWRMTPAYDLVCTLPYFMDDAFGAHMSLGLDEQVGDFKCKNFIGIGSRYGVPESSIRSMLERVSRGVLLGITSQVPPVPSSVLEEILRRAESILA